MSTVNTATELKTALEATGTIGIEVAQSIDLTTGDITGFTVPTGLHVTITLGDGVTILGSHAIFVVQDGATLTLKGNGTIKATTKKTYGAISISGDTAKIILDGATIDAFSHNGKAGNYAYGIYASAGAAVVVKSGTIKAAYGSCIGTNNTTGGGSISITGGSLLCDGSYAIYNPAQGVITISGGTVQGINARMGEIYISGNAQIIGTTLTEADYDNIGANITTSGCIWLGDTIALVMGTYTDPNGTQTRLEISGDAKVTSNFRAAIGTYLVDTKTPTELTINVANPANVTTTAAGYKAIETYDHEYIAAQATAAGKTFSPVVTSTIVVNQPEEEAFEELKASDLKALANQYNSTVKAKEEAVKETTDAIIKRAKFIAEKGGYETSIPFNSFAIPWNAKYRNDVVNKLRALGYDVDFMFYANSLTNVYGINIKWA